MTILLEARGISKHFGGRAVVENVSLQVKARQVITLIGPNGSGKTTLLKLLLGLEQPDSGEITRTPNLHIGYMPQRLAVDPVLPITCAWFLSMHTAHRPTPQAIRDTALELGVAHLLNTRLQDVSGGELQRLMLARALLCEPELLVLDEPVQGVDVGGQSQLYALIARVARARGLSVLMVSHDLHLVMSETDEVICFHHHICCQGHPHAVRDDPAFAALFEPNVAANLAVYTHRHSHTHS